VIRVKAEAAPADFDAQVRQPGLRWLRNHRLPLDRPVPPKTKLEPYWRSCLPQLRVAFKGICAYSALWVEEVTGFQTVDHFVAKSRAAAKLAYEWSNYRFASGHMNSRKRDFDDVLDPFELAPNTFSLNLTSGTITATPGHRDAAAARATIDRLGLNDLALVRARLGYWQEYLQGHIDGDYLERKAPFVWHEANRQGLL